MRRLFTDCQHNLDRVASRVRRRLLPRQKLQALIPDRLEINTMSMTVTPLTPAVGAEVGNVDLTLLSDGEFAQIEAAWHRYSVLLIRGQKLTDDDLLAFSRRLGELDPPPNQERGRQSPPGYPDVYVVSNVLDDKGEPIGALGAGEAVWHTDMSYLDLPPDASMLYALEIPPSGGRSEERRVGKEC